MQHKGVVCTEWLPPLWLEKKPMQGANAGMLTACKLGLAGSDASACTPSTSIASGADASAVAAAAAAAAAAAGLAAHAFCAAGCAGALLAMFGSLACLPFPSALLSMLIPVKPTAELPFTTLGINRST